MQHEIIDFLSSLGYTKVDPNTNLRDFVSSLDIVELICNLEENHDIIIPEEDTHIFGQNVLSIIDYIKEAETNHEEHKEKDV